MLKYLKGAPSKGLVFQPSKNLEVMEGWFFVKAKTFVFSVVEGASVLLLEERRGFSGVMFMGTQGTAWLVSTVEDLLQFLDAKEFVKSSGEGPKVLIIRRGGNSSSRFLEVMVYAMGGWRGLILMCTYRHLKLSMSVVYYLSKKRTWRLSEFLMQIGMEIIFRSSLYQVFVLLLVENPNV